MKSTKSEQQEVKEGSLIEDELEKIGLVRPAFYAFTCDIRPRRSKALKSSQEDIPYINHMSCGLIQEVSNELNYWDVLKDMGEQRIDLPLLEQVGGTCVFYSCYTAQQIIDKKSPKIPKIPFKVWCDTNMSKEFSTLLRSKGGVYVSTSYAPNESGQIKVRKEIIKKLKSNLILAGGNINIAKDRKYGIDSATKVPVFNFWETNAGHNVCIIGCYKDEQFGNCFLTKMTNARDSVGIPKEFGGSRKVNTLSYGLIPFKYFDGDFFKRKRNGMSGKKAIGEGLTITEFGYVPIEHDITSSMQCLRLSESIKF